MKTALENNLIINFCLNRPMLALIVLVLCFGVFIATDQTFLADPEINPLIKNLDGQSKFKFYTSTYIGWLSTNPDLIRYSDFRFQSDSNILMDKIEDIKATFNAVYNYLKLQGKFAERILLLILN